MWGSSKTAKYLMPMLSAETRLSVMHQIQEEAKESGMDIPPIFEDIDNKTGMPKILAISQEVGDPESLSQAILDDLVDRTDPNRVETERGSTTKELSPPKVVVYEACVQTDQLLQYVNNYTALR